MPALLRNPAPSLAAAAAFIALTTRLAVSAPVIDQQYFNALPFAGSNAGLSGTFPNQERAQTFRAGLTGQLVSVDAFVHRMDNDHFVFGGLTLDVRETMPNSFPDPRATPLGTLSTAFVSGGDIPRTGNEGFVNFALSTPISVVQGSIYAITLRADGSGLYGWLGGTDNPYPAGASFERQLPNHNWFTHTSDFGFRTYVVVPEPGSVVIAVALLTVIAGTKVSRRRTC